MIEYFKNQFNKAQTVTAQDVDRWVDARKNMLSAKELQEFREHVTSKIGKQAYYFFLEIDSSSGLEVVRIFEDEAIPDEYEFVEMLKNSKMPKFKRKEAI